MTTSSYPTDRTSIIARGLLNLRGQVKSITGELEWTKRHLAEMQEADRTIEVQRVAEFRLRIVNLEDVLRVLAVYIELGEAEQKRLSKQPTLFEESEVGA